MAAWWGGLTDSISSMAKDVLTEGTEEVDGKINIICHLPSLSVSSLFYLILPRSNRLLLATTIPLSLTQLNPSPIISLHFYLHILLVPQTLSHSWAGMYGINNLSFYKQMKYKSYNSCLPIYMKQTSVQTQDAQWGHKPLRFGWHNKNRKISVVSDSVTAL